jgi:Putative lumazine-binding
MIANNEVGAIEAVVKTYLDGLYEGDTDKLATVFHPTSALTGMSNGELAITPRDAWFTAVRTRPSPKKTGLTRHDQILTIDQPGPTMAFVKVQCAIPPRFFTDQLSLLKVDGRWQIVQKVFMTDVRG